MSRWRTRGSNGDSHASISDLSSGAVLLKLFAMMVQLSLLLNACDISTLDRLFFTALDVVEREMLISSGFIDGVA